MSITISSVSLRPAVILDNDPEITLNIQRLWKGDKGDKGDQGVKGDQGIPGSLTQAYIDLANQVHSDAQQTATDRQAADASAQSVSAQAQQVAQNKTQSDANATAAATSAATATQQAGIATEKSAIATEQAALATQKADATAADRDAVALTASQVVLNKTATDNNLAATQIALQTAQSQAAEAGTSAAASASARDQSVAARDLSIAAWSASMAPAEKLPAISKLMHSGSVVKSLIYDTSKDSDGGQWRKRCQGKSWYTESINGTWLGQAATAVAAWSLSGAVTGAYFQNTTDGKFYALGAASPAVTETLRGNVREFPEQVGIIVEAARVVIYDLTQPLCPMWKVIPRTGKTLTSVATLNGKVFTGSATGVFVDDFLSDVIGISEKYSAATTPAIASSYVNDITISIPDYAAHDSVTGLPVPILTVATNGGVSIIRTDGTVVNWLTNKGYIKTAYINRRGGLAATGGETVGWSSFFKNSIPAANDNTSDYLFDATSIPSRIGTNSGYGKMETVIDAGGNRALASNQQSPVGGLTLLKDNPANPSSGMVAFVQSSFNSGWLVGGVRGAWLADVVPEVISAVESVINGGFDTDLSSWAQYPMNGGSFSVNSGRLQITAGAGQYAQVQQMIAGLVIGKVYQLKFDVIPGTFNVPVVQYSFGTAITVGNSAGLGQVVSFIATAASVTVTLAIGSAATSGQTILFDNVSLKQVVADRSVKGASLNIIGSLTKSAVASGAAMQKFSGFTAGTNYLSQPYSANLDYGTGDFYYAFWMDSTNSGCKMSRGSGSVAGSFAVVNAGAGGVLSFQQWTGSAMATVASATIPAGIGLCIVQRVGTSVQIWWNGMLIASATSANTMTCAAGAEFHVGNMQSGSQGDAGWTALLRTGAVSISADQIAIMYADELPLFQPGAQCTIDGTSSGVTALAYDDVTDLLHVCTSWGRSTFRGLLRVDSEASSVGIVSSVSGNQGARLIAGATGCRIYQPSMLLRDELRREEAARRALGQRPQFIEFDAVAAQTAFVIPKGYTAKAVYSAGTLQREGSTKSYTRSFDGFSETINFAVAPGAAVWVSIMCVRS